MKKGIVLVLVVGMVLLGVYALAAGMDEGGSALDRLVTLGGPLEIVLPEKDSIALGKTVDAYVLSWEAPEAVHSYTVSAMLEITRPDGNSYLYLADGMMGTWDIKDGAGKTHKVKNAIVEATELGGDATSVDVAAYLNKLMGETFEAGTRVRCVVCVLVVPEAGAPVVQAVEVRVK